jgi:hypothetical protein
VQQLGGALQVIALAHANFEDEWFANSDGLKRKRT